MDMNNIDFYCKHIVQIEQEMQAQLRVLQRQVLQCEIGNRIDGQFIDGQYLNHIYLNNSGATL